MIYTVTFNPALDYIVSVPDFCMGKTNRTVFEQMFPGGKGVNVSIVLNNLGIVSTALGFTAEFIYTAGKDGKRARTSGILGRLLHAAGTSERYRPGGRRDAGDILRGAGSH